MVVAKSITSHPTCKYKHILKLAIILITGKFSMTGQQRCSCNEYNDLGPAELCVIAAQNYGAIEAMKIGIQVGFLTHLGMCHGSQCRAKRQDELNPDTIMEYGSTP